jgi:hypothetical protein
MVQRLKPVAQPVTRRPRRIPPAAQAILVVFAAWAIGGWLPEPSWAGGTSGDANIPSDTIKRRDDTINPALLPVSKGEIRFSGTVLDKDSRPLTGVQVKVYLNGIAIHTAATDAVGQYDFRCPINTTGKETVALWFVDPTRKLTPKALILAESPTCRDRNLISPCYPRVAFEPVVESRVHLFDKEFRAGQLFAAGCM